MKLKFKHQAFQTDAVNAAADLFVGQNKKSAAFSIVEERQIGLQNEFGVGNLLALSDEQIRANMNAVQKRNNLAATDDVQSRAFCVEMETGTGKTYVYTK